MTDGQETLLPSFHPTLRAVIKFPTLQGKAPKEIYVVLTETLAFFLPGRAKDLSAPLLMTDGQETLLPGSLQDMT